MTDSAPELSPRIAPQLLCQPAHCLALGFGSGLAPVAPGTFGTLAALPLWWLLAQSPLWLYTLLLLLAFALGVYVCGKTAAALGVHDHPGIVWDEFAGLWIALFAVPVEGWWWLLGFLLFRLFDIWKPWPIRLADRRVHGGLGIMLDDVLAGILSCVLLHALRFALS